MEPFGDVGAVAGRDKAGRFVVGNCERLNTGARSAAFWASQANARREIVAAIVSDAGSAIDDAPRALLAAADGIAQALLLRDSAFARLVESGGPLTSKGRTRRAFAVWLQASDRVERQLRLVGLKRVPHPAQDLKSLLAVHDEEER